jgi:hypothetical protein
MTDMDKAIEEACCPPVADSLGVCSTNSTKKFDQTTESMQYGELFLRFRKRDGFLVTRPSGNIVVLKTKAGLS